MELLLLSLALTCPEGPASLADAAKVDAHVEIVVADGTAEATVNYRFTPGTTHLDQTEAVENSDDAVATGAMLRVGEKAWKGSSILPADAESEFEDYLQSLSYGVEPDDHRATLSPEPAIRLTANYGSTILRVGSPCAYGPVEVKVFVSLASTWDNGEWIFEIPGPEDARVTSNLGIVDDKERALRVRPKRARLRGRFAEVALDATIDDNVLRVSRAELDVPAQLSDLDRPVAFAFVIDRSVSAGEKLVARQIELMNDVLDQAPRGSVYTAVAFARLPSVLVSPWSSARSRTRRAPRLKNGSDLRAAANKALSILEDAPHGSTPRLIILSDMLALDRVPLRGVLSEDSPLTHVVELEDYAHAFSRTFTDQDDRARDVEVTGGIWVTTGPKRDRPLALHLVRPTRIDRPLVLVRDRDVFKDAEVTLDGSGATQLPAFLVEGQSVRLLAHHRGADIALQQPRALGFVWATPIATALYSSDAFSRVSRARMTSGHLASTLDDDALRELAERSQAVTRVTPHELVPSWRMAREHNGGLGLVGVGSCGCGGSSHSHGTSCRGARGGVLNLSGHKFLKAWADEAGCAAPEPGAHVVVEVGDREIMNSEGSATCHAEKLWGLRLDVEEMSAALRDEFKGRRRYIIVWE